MFEPIVESQTSTCHFCNIEIEELDLDKIIHCSIRKIDEGVQWACPDCSKIHCQDQRE